MSAAGSSLTAKMVLTGDAKGIVGAAKDADAALKQVASSARDAGKAGGDMGKGFDAATVAVAGQTKAQEAARSALSLTGQARQAEIVSLAEHAKASGIVTQSVAALNAAHMTYNATVAQARNLLGAGVIDQAKYKLAVDAAGAALAKAIVETEQLGSATQKAGVSVAEVERLIARLGVTGGIAGGQIALLRDAIRVLGDFPIAGVIAAGTAALVASIAVQDRYQNSLRQIDLAVIAHNNTLGLTRDQYQALALDIAKVANVSEAQGRTLTAQLVGSTIDPSQWKDLTAAAAGFARVTGQDVPQALAALIQAASSSDGFGKLNEEYHLAGDGQTEFIKHLDDSGQSVNAAGDRIKLLRDRFASARDMVGLLAGALEALGRQASNFLDRSVNGGALQTIFDAAGVAVPVSSAERAAAQAQPQSVTGDPGAAQRATLSAQVGSIVRQNNPFAQQLADLQDQAALVSKARAANAIDEATKVEALNGIDTKRQQVLKAQRDAYLALNDTLKQHLDRIKELIAGGPEAVSQQKAEADAAVAVAGASEQSSYSQQKLSDALAIQKATLPYVTALMWAHGSSATALTKVIAQLTDQMNRQQTAQHFSDAVKDINSQLAGLNDSNSISAINAQLSEQVRQLDNWKAGTLAALAASGQAHEQYDREVEIIYNSKIRGLLDDDLARRQDWAAGVQRSLRDLSKSESDWATTSEGLTRDTASEFKQDFVDAIVNQKNPLEAFFTWYIGKLAEVVYQTKLASSFDAVAGGLTDVLGKAFGLGGGGGVTGTVSVEELPITVTPSQFHSGGRAGSPQVTRSMGMSVTGNGLPSFISSLPHFHGGTGGLQVGEVLSVLKDDETVQTAQERQAQLEQRLNAQPQVYMVGGPANGNAAPVINIVNNAPGTEVRDGGTKTGPNGQSITDIIIDQVDQGLAKRSRDGNSVFTQSLEQTHGLGRRPG
jgi:hypothetical protein